MKRLSLQWRITLMSVLLIGITCVAMNLLLCSSDRKSTRLNSSHSGESRMPSSA